MNKGIIVAGALGSATALLLTGCGSNSKAVASRERNPAPCRNIIVLQEAARLVDFGDAEEAIENVKWSAEIESVSLGCRYFADEPIIADLDIAFAFGRGPVADAREHTFDYFVAVTRTNTEVIAKETFSLPIKFSSKENVVRREVEIEKITIPRAGEQVSGTNFEVVVGLALTPQQAVFNRSGKSLKFPELE